MRLICSTIQLYNMHKIALLLIVLITNYIYAQETIQSGTLRRSEKFNFIFSLASDLVSKTENCYTLNVRIYSHSDDGQVNLVANQNVIIGDCTKKAIRKKLSGNCSNATYKKDYIIGTDNNSRFCLKELLKDKTIYSEYKYRTTKTIETTN